MRDIRDDLNDRLRKIAELRQHLLGQLRALEVQEAAAKAMLLAEDARFGGEELPLGDSASAQPVTSPTSVFRRFVLECLNDGREWSLSRLSKEATARGISTTIDRSLGRSLHAALLGLKQQGIVEIPEPGHWKLIRHDTVSYLIPHGATQ
jgi:hypothetical protein